MVAGPRAWGAGTPVVTPAERPVDSPIGVTTAARRASPNRISQGLFRRVTRLRRPDGARCQPDRPSGDCSGPRPGVTVRSSIGPGDPSHCAGADGTSGTGHSSGSDRRCLAQASQNAGPDVGPARDHRWVVLFPGRISITPGAAFGRPGLAAGDEPRGEVAAGTAEHSWDPASPTRSNGPSGTDEPMGWGRRPSVQFGERPAAAVPPAREAAARTERAGGRRSWQVSRRSAVTSPVRVRLDG